jgi:hypothetical protein
MPPRPLSPGECGVVGSELGELADPAIDGNRAAVLLRDDVVADREAETVPSPVHRLDRGSTLGGG